MTASKPSNSFGALLWFCAIVGVVWFANGELGSRKLKPRTETSRSTFAASSSRTFDPELSRKLEAAPRVGETKTSATLASAPAPLPSTSTRLVPRRPASTAPATVPDSLGSAIALRSAPKPAARDSKPESPDRWLWSNQLHSVQRQYSSERLPRPRRDLATLSYSELSDLWLWNSQFLSVQRQYDSNPGLPQPRKDLAEQSYSELSNLWLWNSQYLSVARQFSNNTSLTRPSNLAALSYSELSSLWLRNSEATSSTWQPRVAENGSYYGQPNVNGVPKTVAVRGYFRSDGTYVRGHYRSPPGSNPRGFGRSRR